MSRRPMTRRRGTWRAVSWHWRLLTVDPNELVAHMVQQVCTRLLARSHLLCIRCRKVEVQVLLILLSPHSVALQLDTHAVLLLNVLDELPPRPKNLALGAHLAGWREVGEEADLEHLRLLNAVHRLLDGCLRLVQRFLVVRIQLEVQGLLTNRQNASFLQVHSASTYGNASIGSDLLLEVCLCDVEARGRAVDVDLVHKLPRVARGLRLLFRRHPHGEAGCICASTQHLGRERNRCRSRWLRTGRRGNGSIRGHIPLPLSLPSDWLLRI
mmetsp:Transcript_2994/g.10489  ORF Transcript_2994/g.10489 Transcript_2994/m.10489 type:complete len:269 (-) Transcript_2994:55-861(-)